MSEIHKNFIEYFHNIPGETIKEKHRKWFNFLHKHIDLRKNSEELNYLTSSLQPSNHLETILYVDFLIYFQRFDELYERFKNGEDITLRKLSKKEWFFQKAFKEVDVEDFVNKILPATSYALKLKILHKLPVEEPEADEYFEAINKKYGLFLASNLLTKCTTKKIREVLTTQPVRLTEAQIKKIYNKEPDLLSVYYEKRTKHVGNSNFMNHAPTLQYLAQKDPKMFSELFDTYNFNTSLGRRTTKKFVESQKEKILEKPEEYVRILNNAALARKLGKDVVDKLIKKSAQGPGTGSWAWREIIKHCCRSQQFNIYQNAYNSVYYNTLDDDIDEMSEEIFDLMADSDIRHRYAERKIEKENNENYLKYVKPDYCFKKFMEKVNHMKPNERAKYVEIVTFCCVLNKDYDILLKVCELVAVRFKNDDQAVRSSFFRNFIGYKNAMEKFSEEHWKLIMEIDATSKAKGELFWGRCYLIASYLKYLIVHDKPVTEVLRQNNDWYDIFTYTKAGKDPTVFKPVMIQLIEMGLVKVDPNEKLQSERFDCMLASLCKKFNEKYPNDSIEIRNHPRIKESVKKILLEEDNYDIDGYVSEGVRYIVCQLTESEEIRELKYLYFKVMKSFGASQGIRWFLKNEPKMLQDNFEEFLKIFPEVSSLNSKRLWLLVKKYPHLKFDEKVIDFCKEKLTQEFNKKEKLIRPLTLLSSPISHLEFVKTYIPTSDTVDFIKEDEKELYNIQGRLFRLLHLIKAPREVLPVAFELCRGDYLQFALSPLYSCMYKLPENEARPYIDKLDEKKAISVKKHAMNLTCVIYDKEVVYNCLKNATVPSLLSILKYFAKNPSSAFWELAESNLYSIKKKDLHVVKPAMDILVPFNYKSKFIETIWKLFDQYDNKEFKKVLLPKIDHGITKNFKEDFAINIIKTSIFKIQEANDFVANLIIHVKSEEKFTLLSQILNQYKNNCWNDKEIQRLARSKMHQLISKIFTTYMAAEESDKKFVSRLSALFKSIFSVTEAFEEWILMSLMSFKDESPERCAEILIDLNEIFEEKYGNYTINLLANAIRNFTFDNIFKTDGPRIKLCHVLLKNGKTVNDQVLCLKLLPKKQPADKEHYLLYKDIIDILTEATNEVIKLQFNLFLRDNPNAKNREINWDMPQNPLCEGNDG